jgi:hypothetical protein
MIYLELLHVGNESMGSIFPGDSRVYIPNHRSKNTSKGSPIKIVNHHRQEYQVCQGRATEQPGRCRLGAEHTNHHCRRRGSRDKYPHGNHKKRSKIDPVKQDSRDHT